MNARQLDDANYRALILRECETIVAENEHKMYVIQPDPGPMNFAPSDALADFARTNGLKMRGHTLVWHHPRWLPDWINETEFSSPSAAEAELRRYISAVASRNQDVIYSWDVVNEAVDETTGEYRETSYSRAMGGAPEVIDACFRIARDAAPGATLAYNDYMSWEGGSANHRTGVLRLLEDLHKRGTPIDALGVQSHSNQDMPDEFTPAKKRAWRAFVDDVTSMGFDIYLTEFDVNDTRLPPDPALRDRIIAAYTEEYLGMMLEYEEVKDLLVWGMTDRDSWLQTFLPREDGVEKRPAPYDSRFRPKPMRDAIARALRQAPPRPA
ncbi:beta-xylanase [Parvularcula lutaonensis]|nr:beta-xylanase [Parvularcula lutaonensis]